MEVYVIDSSNVSTAIEALKEGGKYFIISADVKFDIFTYQIGPNSFLDFRGGSFIGRRVAQLNPGSGVKWVSTHLKLNSCPIKAGAYPIFTSYISIEGLFASEVKAEWFKRSTDTSDDQYINRAIQQANHCPVVLEAKTYTLNDSIRFVKGNTPPQTLICPGTLKVNGDFPAIDIDTQTATLNINKIIGYTTTETDPDSQQDIIKNHGIGVNFSVYSDYCDINVNAMSALEKGFCVLPVSYGKRNSKGKPIAAGIQYCRIKFGSISADYCFYIDVFSEAQFTDPTKPIDENDPNSEKDKPIDRIPYDYTPNYDLGCQNWFNENQISGELMEGKYGIYVVSPEEISGYGKLFANNNVGNVLNGLKFENISFERITELAIRLRSMDRSCLLNMQMYNSMPGNNPNGETDFTPWIDLDYLSDIRMSFNTYVIPTHIKYGDHCGRCYFSGAIIDRPGHWSSHFDTLGIDSWHYTVDSNTKTLKSQMFLTNSVVPYNITKSIVTSGNGATITKYLQDFLPDLSDTATSTDKKQYLSLPVLPSALNVDVKGSKQQPDTLILDLTGLKDFPPCLYTVNANIASGCRLQFKATNNLAIEGGVYDNGTTVKTVTESGMYSIQWLPNWIIRITKM